MYVCMYYMYVRMYQIHLLAPSFTHSIIMTILIKINVWLYRIICIVFIQLARSFVRLDFTPKD